MSLFVHVGEINMLGTVRTNRIPNKKVTGGKIFEKTWNLRGVRGKYKQYTGCSVSSMPNFGS